MRRQAPGLVLQGVEQEEIFPGEALAGDHHRIGAEIRHVQGVLGPVHTVAEQPDGVGVRRLGRRPGVQVHRFLEPVLPVQAVARPGVQVHRFLEPVLPVQAVALDEERVGLRPKAGGRQEKDGQDG